MAELCLLTAAGTLIVRLAVDGAFTLAWTHSVEKVGWEEDWRLIGGRLELVEARIRGSGAGMEPPPAAILVDGWWRYRPALPAQERLTVARSHGVEDYRLCWNGVCRPMADLAPLGAGPTVTIVAPCP